MYKSLFKNLLWILLDKYPEVKLLNHMLILFLHFWGNFSLCSTAAVPFYTPSNYTMVRISPHPCQHSLFSLYFYLIVVILTGMRWYLIVILIYISLKISDIEHLFMCLLAICISLEKCLFKSFAHFWIELFVCFEF